MGHIPNKETEKALKELEEGKNLFACDTVEELFEELGKEDSSTE